MRKQTKSSLTRKIDQTISRIVRARGSCAWCGSTETLQAAHIFSRKNKRLRFILMNIICLCAGCHFKAHANPIFFTEFVKSYLGDLNYENLKLMANEKKKWNIDELQVLLNILKDVT
jgi:5-methylcytosine-specific restriction endonuclease McrA